MLDKGASNSLAAELSLRQRVLKAGAWTLAGYFLSQAIRFGSNLIMTRLLAPDMFGLMAIAMTVVVGFAMVFDLGLKPNVIQSRRGSDEAFLNTAWIIQIFHGAVISISALGVAAFLFLVSHRQFVPESSVYADPSLPYVIAGISITGIIAGCQSTKIYQASRAVSLGRITQIEIAAQVIGLLCMLAWASVDQSIWALVAGAVCSRLASTVLSHVWLHGGANRWQWDSSAFREIVRFGKWIVLSSFLGFLVNNGDRLLLASLVSPAVLGVYAIAFLVFSSIEQVVTKMIMDVSFPVLSEIARDHRSDLKLRYYRFQAVIAPLAYFCSGFLLTSAKSLIGILYDYRYEQAGWMLQILAAALLTLPFRTAAQCFVSLGLPHLLSNIIAIRLVALLALTILGFYFFGIGGALWGITLSHFASVPTIIFYGIKHEIVDIRKELCMLPVFAVGLASGKLLATAIGFLQ